NDPDIAKFRACLDPSEDAAGDLLRLPIHGRRGKALYRGLGALALQATLCEVSQIRMIQLWQSNRQLYMSSHGANHGQLRIGECEESIHPDRADTRQTPL